MELPLRVVVLNPPVGVAFAVQQGRTDLLQPTAVHKDLIAFDFSVRVGDEISGDGPNFLGPFAQGPRGGRFVYVNSGQLAGQPNSCWRRRAKVSLGGISWSLVKATMKKSGGVLEAQINGLGRDRGPSCGTVPFASDWRIATR
jgi:Family of unknown function (DUF5990)